MKYITSLLLVPVICNLYAMEVTHKRRRSEVDLLTENFEKNEWLCNADGCPYTGTYKQVAAHERIQHEIYQKKAGSEKIKTVTLPEFSREPDTAIKIKAPLLPQQSLEKPHRAIARHSQLLRALTDDYFHREKKETVGIIKKQEEIRRALNWLTCNLCHLPFTNTFDYNHHLLSQHGYVIPHMKDEAYHSRIKQHRRTPQ